MKRVNKRELEEFASTTNLTPELETHFTAQPRDFLEEVDQVLKTAPRDYFDEVFTSLREEAEWGFDRPTRSTESFSLDAK